MIKISTKYSRFAIFGTLFFIFLIFFVTSTNITVSKATITPSISSSSNTDGLNVNGINESMQTLNQRNLNIISQTSNQIDINSQLKSNKNPDVISYKFLTGDGLKLDVGYKPTVNSAVTQIQFQTTFSSIIEYQDNNQNGIYNPNVDTVIQQILLDHFTPISYSITTLNDSTELYHIKIQDNLTLAKGIPGETPNGTFIADIFIGTGFYQLNGSVITPTQFKLDLNINNFPFFNNTSRLAVMTSFNTQQHVVFSNKVQNDKGNNNKNENAVNILSSLSSNTYLGYFSWNQSAIVDGKSENVTTSGLTTQGSSNNEWAMSINYPHSNSISHDPKIGIAGIIRIPPINSLSFWNSWKNILVPIIIGVSLIIAIFSLMMTKQEYREYLLNRVLHINTGVHNLTMEEVLDNEYRDKILGLIIDNPGIHYKELLRQSGTSASNLAWHLDILETYKIIHKQRVGHYLIYYPYLDKNPFAKFNYKIAKSKATLDIFQIIGDNPGIYQSQISKRMEIDHKTVKYHIDKLIEAELIYSLKHGRKNRLYAMTINNESENYINGKMDSEEENNDF